MNYNIDGILVPSYLIERSFFQRTRDFFYDLAHLPSKVVKETAETTKTIYMNIKSFNRFKNKGLEKLIHPL